MSKPAPQCPAATIEHPIFAPAAVARCGISGMMQMAEESPCCGNYVRCPIWKAEREREWENKRSQRATQMITHDGWRDA